MIAGLPKGHAAPFYLQHMTMVTVLGVRASSMQMHIATEPLTATSMLACQALQRQRHKPADCRVCLNDHGSLQVSVL